MDIARKGVAWVSLSSGISARSTARNAKPAQRPEATANTVPKLDAVPVPVTAVRNVKASGSVESSYYTWVDQFDTLGLGANVPIATANLNDGFFALVNGEFVTLRVPYPLGFYAKWSDGRIDDPGAGWKGRAMWATTSTRAPFHMEGGLGTKPKVVKFQLRPNPLARMKTDSFPAQAGTQLILGLLSILPTLAFAKTTPNGARLHGTAGRPGRALASATRARFCISKPDFRAHGRRAIVGVHQHYETFEVTSSSCRRSTTTPRRGVLPGKDRSQFCWSPWTTPQIAGECSSLQLFDPNGRLVATSVKFDAAAAARPAAARRNAAATGPRRRACLPSIYKHDNQPPRRTNGSKKHERGASPQTPWRST